MRLSKQQMPTNRPKRRGDNIRALRVLGVAAVCLLAGGELTGPTDHAQAAALADTGYRDFSFGSSPSAPTAKDGQSKLWFADGIWWGSLYSDATRRFQIHRLDSSTQTWSDTGAVIDDRDRSRADTLWDGTSLYVVTSGLTSTNAVDNARILRFSYSAATKAYTLDPGFPVTLPTGGGMEDIGIEKDTTGRLWVTYTKSQSVYVAHSTTDDASWAAPFVLPSSDAAALLTQDESAIVSFNSKIGVMWSDQARTPSAYHFATHVDGAAPNDWQFSIALQGSEVADNHMNLKALDGDPAGQVFAVVKTSLNAATAPLYYVLRLGNNGVWSSYVFGTVADNHTRAQIALDPENRRLYVMATSPCCSGGTIYYKETSLDNISFEAGKGAPFIELASDQNLNNISTTKQPVDSSSGLVAITADDRTNFYAHNSLGIGPDTDPPETTIVSGPSGTVLTRDASFTFVASEAGSTFACRLDGAPLASCTSPKSYTGLADGTHTFDVEATDPTGNVDPTPASRTWTVDTSIQAATLTPDADAHVRASAPNTNYGAATALITDNSPQYEGYLRFSIPALPGSVVSATLRLFATQATTNGPAVYVADNTWTESGITWNTKPARSGAALDDKGSIPVNTWAEFDVTQAITGAGTVTFNLAQTSSDAVHFASKEATASGNRPQLVVTYSGDPLPETTIDSGPSGPVSSTTATFTFSSSEAGSTFACSLDGAAFAACPSPQTYSALAQGTHAFEVRATDTAGGTDPTPASRSWTVDTVAPTTAAVRPPDGAIEVPSDTNVEADFSEALNAATVTTTTFLLRQVGTTNNLPGTVTYNAATRTAVLDPTAALLAATTYTVRIVSGPSGVADLAGNPLAADRVWSFTTDASADLTPPETTIDSGPSGSVATTTATFAFSSSEPGSSFSCSLDGAAFTTCASPEAYSALAQGAHSFDVRATDNAGNPDPTPASRTWTVDTIAPPAPTITSPPDGTVQSSSTVVLSGTAEPDSTVELLDGGSSVGTTSADSGGAWTQTLNGVTQGPHTYAATARDAAGNLSPQSPAVTVTLDTPPETTIDTGPVGTVSTTTAPFTFSSSEAGSTFACSLDGAPFTPCTSPQEYTGLSEGAHTFQVQATDATGNTDPTPASRSWTVSFTLFSDGFESGDLSNWTSVVTDVDGAATVQSAVVATGGFAARLSESATAGSLAYARAHLSAPQTELHVTGMFRILAEGSSGGNVPILRLFDSVGTRVVSLYRQNLDSDKIRVAFDGTGITTSGRLGVDTWASFELHVIAAGAGASTVEVRLDGALVYQTTTATLSDAFLTVQIGNETKAQPFDLVADDIVVQN